MKTNEEMKYDYRKTTQGIRRFKYPIIYKITNRWQYFLYFIGIAWHNSFSGECTSDFNCCADIGRWAWLRFKRVEYYNN
jgi:hypothetical protein